MLDLIISYINFLILSVSYLVKKFAFLPPNPPKYIIVKDEKEKKENILFLLKSENNQLEYKKLNPKYLDILFFRLSYKYSELLPILIITPMFHLDKCIIYCQGNSGDLGTSFLECYEIALRCNCIIVTFEYPGYGICKEDEITENEFYERIKNVYLFVINGLEFKPNQIILYGFSLGSGIAFDFACKKEYPVAGLILQSPVLSIIRTIYNVKKTPYFDIFNNCDKAKKICTKTLFVHGNHDSIVPYIHGRILASLIPKKYFYDFITVNNADHNNLLKTDKELTFKNIKKFISDITDFNFSNEDSNEDITITNSSEMNNENREESKKLRTHNSIIKSENLGLNKSDELRNTISSLEKEKEYEIKNKAGTLVNHFIENKLLSKREYNMKNVKFDNKTNMNNNEYKDDNKEITIIKPNNGISKHSYSYISKIYNNIRNMNIKKSHIINIKNKVLNANNNYYHVNLGGNNRKNYNDYFVVYNKENNINTNNTKKSLFEKSIFSVNSSTNNISYSKDFKNNFKI